MLILQHSPGEKATIFFESFDGYVRHDGYNLQDGYVLPVITRIFSPGMVPVAGFPQNMVKLDTGLYYFQYILPSGATTVGSYLIDVRYLDPKDGIYKLTLYQIIVSAPYGIYSATVL